MRAALSVAALAVGALAVPYKRDIVVATDIDVVMVTSIVTVTAGTPEATPVHKAHRHGAAHSKVASIEAVPTPEVQAFTAPAESTPEVSAFTPLPVAAPAPEETPVFSFPSLPLPVETPSYSPPAAAPTGYAEIVVAHHNLHRANHSSPDLQWDEGLASSAATIAASCVYAHNVDVAGGGYGQNIAAGVSSDNVSAIITDLFYNGEEPYYASNYGLASPDMSYFENWGHFSQIVWKSTTSVGCATQYCPGGLKNVGSGVQPYFTVCNYKGPGNYAGEYADNIGSPLGQPTANWNTLSS